MIRSLWLLTSLLGVLIAQPAIAQPIGAQPIGAQPIGTYAPGEYAELQARRRALLGHHLPQHPPTDGRARPRLPSTVDILNVAMTLNVPDGRLLPAQGAMEVRVALERPLDVVPLLAFFFEPLEITLDGRSLDFMSDPGSGELLVFLDEVRRGEVDLRMQVAFDGFCQDAASCIDDGEFQHLAQFGWYPLNGEVGLDDDFNVRLDLTLADGRIPGGTGNRTLLGRDGRFVSWRLETTRGTILPAIALSTGRAAQGGLIQVDLPPQSVDNGRFIASVVQDALDLYAELFGPYPFERLGITPIADRAGVGLGPQANIFLPQSFWLIPPDAMEAELVAQVTAHEVAHQYFFNLVRIIDEGEGWMSEAFAEYAATRMSQRRTGRLDHVLGNYWDYVLGVPPRQDAALNSAQVNLRPADIRQRIIYFKGSALLHQLAQRMPAFDDYLQEYVQRFSDEITTTRDFIRFLNDVGPDDIDGFLRQWTQRPGLPYLQVSVTRPRDGDEALAVWVSQTQDGQRFEGLVPWVARYENGDEVSTNVGINSPVEFILNAGRAQSNAIDPTLSIFRRVAAEPPADVNLSGVVDGMDLLDTLAAQGRTAPDPAWDDVLDTNRDLIIDASDTRAVLRSWGTGW